MPIIVDVYDKMENKISIVCVYIFLSIIECEWNGSFKIPVLREYIQNNYKTLIWIFLMNSIHHLKMPKSRLQDNE